MLLPRPSPYHHPPARSTRVVTSRDVKARALLLTLFVAALARVALLAGAWPDEARVMREDSPGYVALAHTLAASGRFANEPAGPPESTRTPGYPALLAPAGHARDPGFQRRLWQDSERLSGTAYHFSAAAA